MKKLLVLVAACFMIAAGSLPTYKLNYGGFGEQDNSQLFKQYCGDVKQISIEIPKVNYNDALVKAAAMKLNTVAPVSIYLYHNVIKSYGFVKGTDQDFPWSVYADDNDGDEYQNILKISANKQYGNKRVWDQDGNMTEIFDLEVLKNKFDYEYYHKDPAYKQPAGIKGNTHAFLTYLCGEFRDRPTMIQAKLEWFKRMIKLPARAQEKIEASADLKDVWHKLTAESYAHYVKLSRAAYDAKEAEHRVMVPLGSTTVDKPVSAYTVCETKYMMTEYVTNGKKPFDSYIEYTKGFMGTEMETGEEDPSSYKMSQCSKEDRDYYYDFRGDSNIKPNSPESNAMIWQANSIMKRCLRNADGTITFHKDVNTEEFDVSICEKYMSRPFGNRWNAARSTLVTWMAHDKKFDDDFQNHGGTALMFRPTLNPESMTVGFRLDGQDYLGMGDYLLPSWVDNAQQYWTQADAGLNTIFGIANGEVKELDMAYARLRNAVDRHTDWYATGYDDSTFESGVVKSIDQAFSPFVASSYEMSESDGFTAPGLTVQAPADNKKQWMYVFRVHKDKWYNTDSLIAGKEIDLESQWFDETSFGTSGLADSERAWDRLGTALEGEMDSILYLHNIERGAIKSMWGEEVPAVYDDGLGETH